MTLRLMSTPPSTPQSPQALTSPHAAETALIKVTGHCEVQRSLLCSLLPSTVSLLTSPLFWERHPHRVPGPGTHLPSLPPLWTLLIPGGPAPGSSGLFLPLPMPLWAALPTVGGGGMSLCRRHTQSCLLPGPPLSSRLGARLTLKVSAMEGSQVSHTRHGLAKPDHPPNLPPP